ncbi:MULTISPECIES: PIN domain-containing protein [unclassified Microcoleus]|uniref:PIN domain-containing protein n=1 Tax=unclassified Microcoleus TaxID=2642155 RepID=UPI00312B8628
MRIIFCPITRFYEWIIPSLNLPDPNDRHILAAAIKSEASAIVTFNLKDFPPLILDQYEIEAQHPDDFILDLIDLNYLKVANAVTTCHQRLKNPPKSLDEYLEILLKQGLQSTVKSLQQIYK